MKRFEYFVSEVENHSTMYLNEGREHMIYVFTLREGVQIQVPQVPGWTMIEYRSEWGPNYPGITTMLFKNDNTGDEVEVTDNSESGVFVEPKEWEDFFKEKVD